MARAAELAVVVGADRFADLASIIDHLAAEWEIGEAVTADEAYLW